MKNIILYPNPSRGVFYIKFPFESEDFDVSVYNVLGELVIKERCKSSLQQFDLSDYPKGIYTVQVRSRLQSKRMQISLQ